MLCTNSIEIDGIPGISIEFDLNGIPPSPKKCKAGSSDDSSSDDSSSDDDTDGSFRFMRISSIPVPFDESHIKADRFAVLCTDARFIAYLKAIIAKALIDHFLVNRILTRESIMRSKFVVRFLNDYFERPKYNFTVHMDVYSNSPEIHMHTFSLTYLVPPDMVIRGTTVMAASKDHPNKNSVSVPIVNGMTLLIKQFHDNKRELFWHSTPKHDSSEGVRNYIGAYEFHESPILSSGISEEMRRSIYANTAQLNVRKLIRNTYFTISTDTLRKYNDFQSKKHNRLKRRYSQIKNEHLSALTFDEPWLNQIIAFVEWVAVTMPQPFICPDETHESVDTMVGHVGEMLGVGGHNNRSNKRSNKRGNKRRNKRKSKRTKSKRSYKRRK